MPVVASYSNVVVKKSLFKAYIKVDKDGLFALMDSHEKFSWMKMRISRMWDTLWIPAVEALDRKGELQERSRKKVRYRVK